MPEPIDYMTSLTNALSRLGTALGYKDNELILVPLLNEAAERIEELEQYRKELECYKHTE